LTLIFCGSSMQFWAPIGQLRR